MDRPPLDKVLSTLPERTRRRLDELRGALQAALGDELSALLVFGSAVRGGYRAEQSDVDVMIVLRDDRRELIERMGPALLLARNAARIEAMIVKASEVQRAADVFPLLYDDIRERSVVLHGTSPFDGLHIADAHRRLRIEQELRECRIRARRLLSDSDGDARLLAGGVDRKLKQIRSPLLALLQLRGEPPAGDGLEEVLRASSASYKLSPASLFAVRERPRDAYDALAALLDAAIADVDARGE